MARAQSSRPPSVAATRPAGAQVETVAGRRRNITTKLRLAFRRLGLVRFLADVLALVGVVLAVNHTATLLALGFLVAALVMAIWRGGTVLRRAMPNAIGPTATAIMVRIFVVLGVGALSGATAAWPPILILGLTLLAERWVASIARVAVPYAENLPGVRVRNEPVLAPKWIFAVNSGGVIVFCVAVAVRAPRWFLVLLVIAVLLVSAVSVVDATLRILIRYRGERLLPHALSYYGPTFYVYWYAPTRSGQLAMWLPYLERLDRPFVIVVRNPATFNEITSITTRPVLVRRYRSELDALLVPSVRTVFFVNTSPRNADMLQFLELNQIQLNHGDSDKATSYRRLFREYDKNFVAGQAAIDRFANHGVRVPRDAFEIVGRPQVEGIAVADRPISARPTKVVLYAPTWFGYLADSHYSSLPIGYEIVSELIERECVVIFRPHPWSARNLALSRQIDRIDDLLHRDRDGNDRPHVFGKTAQVDLSLVDCFNGADALVSDVSSVVPDFLYSEKPFAVTVMQPDASDDDVIKEFPLAAGGYLISRDAPSRDTVFDDLLLHDPRAATRRELKKYYLGDFDTTNYADAFVDVARRYV